MSKNKNITDKPNIPIPRLKSFDPTITRNNIILKQAIFLHHKYVILVVVSYCRVHIHFLKLYKIEN